jgi:hypothetical protein
VGRTIQYTLNEIARRVRDRIYHLGVTRLYTLRLIDDLQAHWWYSIACLPITGYVDPDLAARYAERRVAWVSGFAVVGGTEQPVVYDPPYTDAEQPAMLERISRLKPLRLL